MFYKIRSDDLAQFILLESKRIFSEGIGNIIRIDVDAKINGIAIDFDIF